MNKMERRPAEAAEAKVEFLDGDFRIVRPGAFVRCAVTGEPIPLEELRYWSVDRQEAYASPGGLDEARDRAGTASEKADFTGLLAKPAGAARQSRDVPLAKRAR